MRQLTTIFLLIFGILTALLQPVYSAVKGGINYSIPIYYDKLSETELQDKVKIYFYNAMQLQNGEIDENMTQALNIYTILQNLNPENIEYSINLGRLYEKIGKDRYAKGNFSRAIGINSLRPESYFYFGEYYYNKQLYRKAIKYYNEAYKNGYQTNYNLLYKLGDVYEKLGDTRSAIKYLKDAEAQSPNPELAERIKRVEAEDAANSVYNKDTRIRSAK